MLRYNELAPNPQIVLPILQF